MAAVSTERNADRVYRAKAGAPALVDVPPSRFLAIDGKGSPDDPSFPERSKTILRRPVRGA